MMKHSTSKKPKGFMTYCIKVPIFIILFFITILHGEVRAEDPPSRNLLFYKVKGDGKPTLLMLHGMLGSHRYWDGVLPNLAAKNKVILVDLLGFGDSPKPHVEYTVQQHIFEIEKVVKQVHQKSFQRIIVGHSMGAFLALNYATTYPEKIEKLILINPPLQTDRQSLKAAVGGSSSQLMVNMTFNETWGKLVCYIHELFPAISYPLIRLMEPELPPAVAKAAGQHTYESYRGSFENVLMKQNFYDLLNQVPNLPILILARTNDKYTKEQALDNLPKRSNLKLVVLNGNHNVLLSSPELVAAEILKFIENELSEIHDDRAKSNGYSH